jgi:hypothetical protein
MWTKKRGGGNGLEISEIGKKTFQTNAVLRNLFRKS